jgi:hypothetical protein
MRPVITLLLLTSTALAAAQVSVDYDHAIDFTRYRTFG